MQPGYYGQTSPTMGGTPSTGMPFGGMPYGGMPFGGMPYSGMPFEQNMGMPYGGMPYGPTMGTFTTPFGAFHCPMCGYSGPVWHSGMSPTYNWTGGFGYPFATGFGGLGGLRRHGGAYTPQFMATGLPTDEEIVEMVYDTLDVDPLVPYDANIDVECDAGVVTLAGTVPNKHAKHAAGDDAWWVPGVTDVKNQIKVSGRHRVKTAGKPEQPQRTR